MPVSFTRALMASGSVLSQVANLAAASTFFDCVVTAVKEPPQLPVAGLAASHCGMAATFHWPAVDSALPERTPGPQAALSQPTCLPVFRPVFQAGVYMGWL